MTRTKVFDELDTTEVLDDDMEVEMVDPGYDPEDCIIPEGDFDFLYLDDVETETVEEGYDPEDGINPDITRTDDDYINISLPKDFKGSITISIY